MARYNTSSATTSINGSTTISSPYQGVFTELTGTAPYTVTLPSPVLYPGQSQTFYNATSGTITLNTPSGMFSGLGGSGTSNQTVPVNTVVSITSDGTNYVVLSEDGSVLYSTDATITGNLTVSGATSTTTITTQNISIAPTSTGNINNMNIGVTNRGNGYFATLSANGSTTLTANVASSSTGTGTLVVTGGVGVSGAINAGSVTASTFTGTIQTAAQTNITSVGTLTSLSSSGNISGTNGRLVLRDDSVENWATDTDTAGISVNFYGYQGGTTRNRNFSVYNGKGSLIFSAVGSTNRVGIGTNTPTNLLSIGSQNHTSPGDPTRILNWYATTGGSEIANGSIPVSIGNSSTNTAQPATVGISLYNSDSTANTWSPAITFGGLSTSGNYMNGSAGIAVQLLANNEDNNFKGGNLHFFTQGITSATRGLVSKMYLGANGNLNLTKGFLRLDSTATGQNKNGFNVERGTSGSMLAMVITDDNSTNGWGWEFTDGSPSSTSVNTYLRVDYPSGTLNLRPQTIASLDSSQPAGSIAYVTDGGGNLYYKNSGAWVSFTALLGSAANPAPSATAILTANASKGSGYYYIKPNGVNVYYVYCDMVTDGGGWMLMINARPNNGGQYYNNNDYGLSTIDGVANVVEYNKSTTSMFGTTKINHFFSMSGFKYGRMTPGPGISITSPYTGLYQRIGTSTSYYWMGTGFDCSNRSNIAATNPWVLTQYQNWSDCVSGANGRTGGYTGGNHYYPTTYDNGWQNFWKGDQDGLRFSSTFSGENYGSIGQNTSPGYWWIKSDI